MSREPHAGGPLGDEQVGVAVVVGQVELAAVLDQQAAGADVVEAEAARPAARLADEGQETPAAVGVAVQRRVQRRRVGRQTGQTRQLGVEHRHALRRRRQRHQARHVAPHQIHLVAPLQIASVV